MAQRLAPGLKLERHRHAEPYAALVLSGVYEEAGDLGRVVATPGMLIVHDRFDAHLNRIGAAGATVINLPLTGRSRAETRRVGDVDAVVRLAQSDLAGAAQLALSLSIPHAASDADWPDLLATRLRADPALHLASWADEHGLAPGSLSRGFARVFGVSPKRFRYEIRARRALDALIDGADSVAAVAADCGFADQSHLHRSVMALTGRTPRTVRAAG